MRDLRIGRTDALLPWVDGLADREALGRDIMAPLAGLGESPDPGALGSLLPVPRQESRRAWGC